MGPASVFRFIELSNFRVSTYHSYDGMTEEENSDSASWTVAYHLEDGVWKLQNFQW